MKNRLYNNLANQIKELKEGLVVANSIITARNTTIGTLNGQVSTLTGQLSTANNTITNMYESIVFLEAMVSDLNEQIEALQNPE